MDDMDEMTNSFSEPYFNPPLSQGQSLFPHIEEGFNYAFANAPVLLNGMKVIFDRSVPVYPVNLKNKQEMNDDE
jgi:hypothetical protein